ncbi:MAG: pyrroloquinoline quinone biosynthesis protein PqqB [Burkholderiales bacterium]|nr:MAG: pyrroloquinoline quinone biosynthesis protein PqqB [Burkholderiales bacterium]
MRIRVLGSSAGGGFPQWNCNCPNCDGLRRGALRARARTQSSIALSQDGTDWLLVNASPDILQQIKDTPALQPGRRVRDSGIAAVLLMDAQIDHVTGLLMLRERGTPLPLLATPEVVSDISDGFPLTRILAHYCGTQLRELPVDGSVVALPELPGLEVRTVSLASQPPPYSPFRGRPRPGDNIGLLARNPASGAQLFYAPGLAAIGPELLDLMAACDVVLVDGTFWTNDEMQRLGLSGKTALEMGHLPQSGPGGMIEQLDRLPARTRKILIHINNTNPMLVEDSPERQQLVQHGIEVAFDGMELEI